VTHSKYGVFEGVRKLQASFCLDWKLTEGRFGAAYMLALTQGMNEQTVEEQ
jgi:hypothetical protein